MLDPALDQLLDAVHGAVRSGDFAALPALTARVQALDMQVLAKDPALLRRVQQKLGRTVACLLASARGLRAARRRMTEITAARAGLQTYTRSGGRAQIGATSGTLARRF